jgi:hypothetical protein
MNSSTNGLSFLHLVSTFNPMLLWDTLSALLYSSTYPAADLKCLDPSGESVACPNGVCRVIFSSSHHRIYSSCFETKSGNRPYVLDAWESPSGYFDLKFSCNKSLCNSKETTQQVLKILTSADIISKSIINKKKLTN